MPVYRLFTLLIALTARPAAASVHGNAPKTVFHATQVFHFENDSNHKLLIFLHGGVNNPVFLQSAGNIEPAYLFENNNLFQSMAAQNGFDVIAPVAHDSIHWLLYPENVFNLLKDYIDSVPKLYNEIYISGFSDGGTGSYKIFYTHPDFFTGLIVFNGFPQHANFNKKVNYNMVTGKRILFLGTYQDKTIPYEFLLTEYCRQKQFNSNTWFYLARGKHSFAAYKAPDLGVVFSALSNENTCSGTIPVQAYIVNDSIVAAYRFRKKISRRYHIFYCSKI